MDFIITTKHQHILKPLHICIITINFDKSPEGICTGLLTRALLAHDCKITLITSRKAQTTLKHKNLNTIILSYSPREPRFLLKTLAKFNSDFPDNFYIWTKRASKIRFSNNDIPDIFYGRAWPYSSLLPAEKLAKHYNKPFIAHLSDPVPPPNESHNKLYTQHLQHLIEQASYVTFTNEETIAYQKKFTQFDRKKAMVLPHVAPNYCALKQQDNNVFCYTGAIGNRASIMPLFLNSFRKFCVQGNNSSFNIVNPNIKQVNQFIKEANASPYVKALPFAKKINDALEPADTLVSLEPQTDKPIWTLTKTIHYLFTNKKIIALTSKGSPTERILSSFPESCVVINNYSEKSLIEGLIKVSSLKPSEQHYLERIKKLEEYTADSVATKFIAACNELI